MVTGLHDVSDLVEDSVFLPLQNSCCAFSRSILKSCFSPALLLGGFTQNIVGGHCCSAMQVASLSRFPCRANQYTESQIPMISLPLDVLCKL